MRAKTTDKPLRPCDECDRPSRDRVCVACRVRRSRGSAIAGECCAVCGIDHPAVLRHHRFDDGERVLCANHAALAGRRRLTFKVYSAQAPPSFDTAAAVA